MNKRFFRFVSVLVGVVCSMGSVSAQEAMCQDAITHVSQDSLVNFIKEVTGRKQVMISGQLQTIESRYAFHPGNDLAATYLKEKCESYGFRIEDIPYSNTGRNIVAYKKGTVLDKQAYILCAHYDCVGSSTVPFQGADDNASGVAALLEAARVLHSVSFPYTIVLAFWDEEEIGLVGSKAFAPDGPVGYWDVKGVINLDMIGWDGNNDSLAMIHTMPVGNSTDLALKMAELNRKYGTALNTVIKNPGEKNTDQQSFWLAGATAIGLTEDYDHDFNPNWHAWSDSLERMHLPYFTNVSRLAIAAICDLAATGIVTGNMEISKENLMIYPNPAHDILMVHATYRMRGATLSVYDLAGAKVISLPGIDEPEMQLDVAGLRKGMYILEVSLDDQVFRYRFVKG
jgi:hypothetical protein